MDKKIRILRKELSQAPKNRRGYRRVSPALRQKVVALSTTWRSEGGKQQDLARRLGLSIHTISGWRQLARETARARRKQIRVVEIAEEPAKTPISPLCISMPSGLRIEGLSIIDAIAVAKELG